MTGIAEAIYDSYAMNPVVRIGNPGVQESKGESRYISLIGEFHKIGRLGSIKHVALITRDGVLINEIPEKTCTCISAAMMAASLGAAETAFAEIRKGKPDMMIFCMKGERIIIKGAGPKMLLTAIIDDEVNDIIVLPIIEKTAEIIKSMS
jgi:predicted regulator of Ras-like GTPase activity (Roadblock/LC7/MglB family)